MAGEGSSDEPRLPGHRYADRAETTDPGVVSGHLRALGSPRIDDHRPPRGTGRVRIAFEHSLDEEPGDPETNRDGCRTSPSVRCAAAHRDQPGRKTLPRGRINWKVGAHPRRAKARIGPPRRLRTPVRH